MYVCVFRFQSRVEVIPRDTTVQMSQDSTARGRKKSRQLEGELLCIWRTIEIFNFDI